MISFTTDDTLVPGHEEGHGFLLVRRHRDTRELSVYPSRSHGGELLNLLRATVLTKPPRDLPHILRWSRWRRCHQATSHRRWNDLTAAATI
ncbi:hypothetical protein E6W39_19755 [Kitasatospora acidiphila]|uniref:Uncharacterized protein n=1 Tax=Kitasatospora acidiphila TaxID=2567942 RepID=A0A540W4V8_9ACTN|nr:hypothetical protein [Kitasatospora acidiphila]TQF04058.1 hypothetical protein E6W39_19755 [Kitasatospora acidiphila]